MAEQRYTKESLAGWACRGLMGAIRIVEEQTLLGNEMPQSCIDELEEYHKIVGRIITGQRALLKKVNPKA